MEEITKNKTLKHLKPIVISEGTVLRHHITDLQYSTNWRLEVHGISCFISCKNFIFILLFIYLSIVYFIILFYFLFYLCGLHHCRQCFMVTGCRLPIKPCRCIYSQ